MANSILKEIGVFIGGKFALLKQVAFTNSYTDLDNRPTIPSVPAWALQMSKPKYNAIEVEAIPIAHEANYLKKDHIFLVRPVTPEEGDIFIQQ